MDVEEAKALVRSTVDNDDHDWVETDTVDFIWDSANIFRVRDIHHSDVYVYGSANVTLCLMKGHVGPAINQMVKLEYAAEVRRRKQFPKRRGD